MDSPYVYTVMISKSVGGTADNRFAESGARPGGCQSVARSFNAIDLNTAKTSLKVSLVAP